MFDQILFQETRAPTYQYEIKEQGKLGQLLYREFNQGYKLYLDESKINDVANTFEEFIKVNVDNQILGVKEIKQNFQTLTISKQNANKKQQTLVLRSNYGLKIESQDQYISGTVFDFQEWSCIVVMMITPELNYEYVTHFNSSEKQYYSFQFEMGQSNKYIILNLNKCHICFYNENLIKYEKVKCLQYLEYIIQQIHYTNYSSFHRIEFQNTLNKQQFMDQFLLKSDVIKWIAQDFEYEDNQNYQLFKQIRYKEDITYKVPEIFIALGRLSKLKYLYIHNQSIVGECLFGQIEFGDEILFIDISPSQHFVHFYECESEPVFKLQSSIWRYRKPFSDYKIELLQKDKTKLINKIKLKGKAVKGRYIYAKKCSLYVIFHGKLRIVQCENIMINRVIGEYSQKDEIEFESEDGQCIINFISIQQDQAYKYKFKFFD
ncbi:unnamed protein product [Paramecium octaurelia]|uniref:Uncharacterized protein n=1 Tax=Paramecium octaurelia TaxID=43137 RepID=A0A8S1YJZ8_PAROT|nr:unnamed protein product [Paramecium octaurelia]